MIYTSRCISAGGTPQRSCWCQKRTLQWAFEDAVGIANFFCRTIYTAYWRSRCFFYAWTRPVGFVHILWWFLDRQSCCFFWSIWFASRTSHLCITTSPDVKWSFSRRYPHPWLRGIQYTQYTSFKKILLYYSDVWWNVVTQDVTHVLSVLELHNNSHKITQAHILYAYCILSIWTCMTDVKFYWFMLNFKVVYHKVLASNVDDKTGSQWFQSC